MLDIDLMIKDALKGGDKVKVNAYRNLKSKILIAKTAKNAKEYDEVAEISIISKYVKELTEDSKNYLSMNREDLAKDYSDEANVLSELLPKAATEEEIEDAVRDFSISIDNGQLPNGVLIPKNMMGLCIKSVKKKYPSADGKVISEIVRKYIGE